MQLNRTRTLDFTQGCLWKTIIKFALPLFLGNIFQQLYNAVDSLIVGNILGAQALASVSSSGTLTYMMVGFFNGVALGAGVVIARFFGAKDFDKMSKAIHTDIAFGLCAGVFLTVFGVSFTPAILRWMNTPSDIMVESVSYFRNYSMGVLFCVMYNICMGIMNATGDSYHPLVYLVISSITNVILDLLFVAVFDFGVGGAAIATTVGQGISFLLSFVRLLRTNEVYKVSIKKIGFDKKILKDILKNGLPSGFQNSVIGFANVIVLSKINTFSSVVVAGSGVYAKIEGFSFIPMGAFSSALSTCTSQNMGARQYNRAKQGAKFGILCLITGAEVVGTILFIFAPFLVSLFNRNPDVIAIGVLETRIKALFLCMLGFSHGVAGIMRGAGRSYVPMCTMLGCWCLARVGFIEIVTSMAHDIRLVYCAHPFSWALSTIVFIIYLKKMKWES